MPVTTQNADDVAVTGNSDDLAEGTTQLLLSVPERSKIANVPADTNTALSKRFISSRAKIGFLGDSITAATGLPTASTKNANGWPTWFLMYTDGYFEYTSNPSTGGWTTTNMLNTGLPAILSAGVDWCVVFGGINDVTNGFSAATALSNIVSILDQLRAANIRPVLVIPPGANSIDTAAENTEYQIYCAALRRYRYTYPGLIIVDVAQVVNRNNSTYAQPFGLLVHDGVHPSNQGAYYIGRLIAEAVKPHIHGEYEFDADPSNTANAYSSVNGGNSLMTGTSGSKVNDVTGTVATGFTLANYPAGSSTCLGLKVPRRFQVPSWSSLESGITVGTLRLPTSVASSRFDRASAYICTSITTGITGTTEPTWPFTGGTVIDGGVTWLGVAYPLRRRASTTYLQGAMVLPEFQHFNQRVALLATAGGTTGAGSLEHATRIGASVTDGGVTWMTIPYPDGKPGEFQLIDFTSTAAGSPSDEGPSFYTGNIALPAGIVAGDQVELAIEVDYLIASGIKNFEMYLQAKNSIGSTIDQLSCVLSSSTYGASACDLDGEKIVFTSNKWQLPATTTQTRLFIRTYGRRILCMVGSVALKKVT